MITVAIYRRDREVIAWLITEGICGEMIRDLMVECVGAHISAPRAPHSVRQLSDGGFIYAAGETIDVATALNLQLRFTPSRAWRAMESPRRPLRPLRAAARGSAPSRCLDGPH